MGSTNYIKLRYRGRLKQPSDVYSLISETEDICKSNGWGYRIWDEDWSETSSISINFYSESMNFEGHAPLKGITLNIENIETIWLTFMPDGTLQSLLTLVNPVFFLNDANFPWQRIKTCQDGAATHIAICKLFHYLSDKYFDVFEVLDESNYWTERNDYSLYPQT